MCVRCVRLSVQYVCERGRKRMRGIELLISKISGYLDSNSGLREREIVYLLCWSMCVREREKEKERDRGKKIE